MKQTKRKAKPEFVPHQPVYQINANTQKCVACGNQMGIMPGMREAYCKNCGYKDPCCE